MTDYYDRKSQVLKDLLEKLSGSDKPLELNKILVAYELKTGFSTNTLRKVVNKWSDEGLIGKIEDNQLMPKTKRKVKQSESN